MQALIDTMHGKQQKTAESRWILRFYGVLPILRIQIGNEGLRFFHFLDFIYAFDVGT